MNTQDWIALGFFLAFILFVVTCIVVVCHRHRLIVITLAAINCPCYPDARAIARTIYEKPEEWSGDEHYLRHPKIGSIWTANSYENLRIKTPFGEWEPTMIERRIIRDAVDWRLREYIKARLGYVLNQGLLK